MAGEFGIRSRNRIQPVFCRPISSGMVIRRRLDSGLTKNERLEARDGGVLPSVRPLLLSEAAREAVTALLYWLPRKQKCIGLRRRREGEKKERESILGEGLDGPTEGRTESAAECHSI